IGQHLHPEPAGMTETDVADSLQINNSISGKLLRCGLKTCDFTRGLVGVAAVFGAAYLQHRDSGRSYFSSGKCSREGARRREPIFRETVRLNHERVEFAGFVTGWHVQASFPAPARRVFPVVYLCVSQIDVVELRVRIPDHARRLLIVCNQYRRLIEALPYCDF